MNEYTFNSNRGNGYNFEKNMSTNSILDYEEGARMVKDINRNYLKENGLNYPVTFLKWLIKKNIWTEYSRHHVGQKYKLVSFYSLPDFFYGMSKNEIENFLSEKFKDYQNRKTLKGTPCIIRSEKFKKKGIGYKGFLQVYCIENKKDYKYYFDKNCKKPIYKKEYNFELFQWGKLTPETKKWLQERIK